MTSLGRVIAGDLRELEYQAVRMRVRCTPKGDTGRRKFFVIGHPRTGTTSLHHIFLANNRKSSHTSGRWRSARYDAFADRGNFQPFQQLDRRYPNSWFILNNRPAFNYIRSIFRHWNSRSRRKGNRMRGRVSERAVEGEILRRNQHFLDVVRYFEQRGNLLVADIEEPGATEFLCSRLGLEDPGGVWRNEASSKPSFSLVTTVSRAFENLGITDEKFNPFIIPSLLKPSDRKWAKRFLSERRDWIFVSKRWTTDRPDSDLGGAS